ncbi:MAG: type II secretion system F family protein [Pseudomonadota bacterium]|nr:type II secretion system F family protein [Pseudomonadota bacterium]
MDPSLLYLALGATVVAIGGAAFALYQVLNPQRTASDRLAEIGNANPEAGPSAIRSVRLQALTTSAARLAVSDDEQLAALRKRMLQAGFRDRNAVEIYSAIRTVGALVFAVLAFLILPKDKPVYIVGSALVGAAAGYYLPAIWVSNLLDRRKSDLLKAFPDALDLLVSCVEAGLGLDAAFRRVSEEMESAAPDLSRELQLVTAEVNAGVPRTEALRHLSDRTGLDDINALVNVLMQAERFGTSVARALRLHSEHVRVRRMQRAEEKAAQVSPKLTVAMILFILPCLVVILIGPAIINVKNILLPTMAGQ